MDAQNRNLCLKILVNKNRKIKKVKKKCCLIQYRNYCCVQQNLQCIFTLFSTCSEKSHTRVYESLCNQSARQMTKAVPWQCTNHLLQGNPIYCKSEAASVLCYPQGAWDNTWETWVKPWWQPSIYKAKLGRSNFLSRSQEGMSPLCLCGLLQNPQTSFSATLAQVS